MEAWQKSLSEAITQPEELSAFLRVEGERLRPVVDRYPMRITPYYLSLVKEADDPIGRQCIPDSRELKEDQLSTDPFREKELSPVPGIVHRYPDRVVLLASTFCATLCRFCMRKHQVQEGGFISDSPLEPAIDYVRRNRVIRDIIISGGDPLVKLDEWIEDLVSRLRKISHVEIIRINTRIPVTLPERITTRLCQRLRLYHPLYINTHFNHPEEITEASSEACRLLADAGIPLGNQTVLLRGVNDDPAVMKRLMQKLLIIRVRPYYIHQMDPVKGTSHFCTPIEKGLEIMANLRGHTSGMANPYYVIDLPGGKGKVPLLPDDVKRESRKYFLRNFQGETVEYVDEG